MKATLEERGRLSDQLTELYRMVKEGVRPYDQVRPALQRIIDGKFDTPVSTESELIHGYYNPVKTQLEQFREWNEQFNLGFGNDAIAALEQALVYPDNPLHALVITWTLETLSSTLRAKATLLERLVKVYYTNPILFEENQVRLIPEQTFQPNTLEWAVIDLSANWKLAPAACIQQRLAGVELLDVATQHPAALKAQDGTTMPYWNLGAVQVDAGRAGSFGGVAYLDWGRGRQDVDLYVGGADDAGPFWSVPVREV